MYVNAISTLLSMLTDLVGVAGLFNGAKIGLYQNDVYPTKNTALADLTVATFNGVTDWTAITWGAPFVNANTQAEVLGQLVNWLTTSAPTAPVTVYGYAIEDSGGTTLLLAERFATPFIFNASGVHLGVIPRMVFTG